MMSLVHYSLIETSLSSRKREEGVIGSGGRGRGGSGGGEMSDGGDPWWRGSDPWMASAAVSEPVNKKPKLVAPQVENVKKEHVVVERIVEKVGEKIVEAPQVQFVEKAVPVAEQMQTVESFLEVDQPH